jgi:ribosomal protein S27E
VKVEHLNCGRAIIARDSSSLQVALLGCGKVLASRTSKVLHNQEEAI